jgi:hypothetical protein
MYGHDREKLKLRYMLDGRLTKRLNKLLDIESPRFFDKLIEFGAEVEEARVSIQFRQLSWRNENTAFLIQGGQHQMTNSLLSNRYCY